MTQTEFIKAYFDKLSNSLNKKHQDLEDKLTKQMNKDIEDVKKQIPNADSIDDRRVYMFKLIEKIKNYHIKDGYWYHEDKKLDKAVAVDGKEGKQGERGKDGINGKDGLDGKDGKNGRDGVNGKDGKDGSNGKDGKDGLNGIDGKNADEIEIGVKNGFVGWKFKNTSRWNEIVNLNDLKGERGNAGPGIPGLGTTGQVLSKKSNATYDTEWTTPIGAVIEDTVTLAGYEALTPKVDTTIYWWGVAE